MKASPFVFLLIAGTALALSILSAFAHVAHVLQLIGGS